MAHATLVITPPNGVWANQVSTTHPEVTFQVLAAVPQQETGFALVELSGPDVLEAIEDMIDHPQITDMNPVQCSENKATIHFEVSSPFLFMASRESGIAIEHPITIQDGTATVEATGSRDRISELVDHLDAFGVQYRVEQIGERLHESQLLSDRQREFFVTALENGYYDTPRKCSLTDIADLLGVAKSTCSETLHRAEETIVKRFATELPEIDSTEVDSTASALQ